MIAQLDPDDVPAVEAREDGLVGMYVPQETPHDPAGHRHGFALTPDQAIACAEGFMAAVGKLAGPDVAITIWAEEFAIGTIRTAGKDYTGVIATDADGRTVRLAFQPQALREILRQFETVPRTRPTGSLQ